MRDPLTLVVNGYAKFNTAYWYWYPSTVNGSLIKMSAESGRKTAYSADIGWRVVWQHIGMRLTYKQIGTRLHIASSTAHRIFARFKTSGDVVPKMQPLRPQNRELDDHHELLIMV